MENFSLRVIYLSGFKDLKLNLIYKLEGIMQGISQALVPSRS